MNWFVYAFLGMIFFSGMILLFKKITLMGVKPAVLMLYVALFLLVFYVIHIFLTKTTIGVNMSILSLLFVAAFLSYVGNLLYTRSIALAPNPAYATTVVSLQLVIIAVASVFLFASEWSLVKSLGIFLAVVAGILLAL